MISRRHFESNRTAWVEIRVSDGLSTVRGHVYFNSEKWIQISA